MELIAAASNISSGSGFSLVGSAQTPSPTGLRIEFNSSASTSLPLATRCERSYAGLRLRKTRTSPPATTRSTSATRDWGRVLAKAWATLTAMLVQPRPPLPLYTATSSPFATSEVIRRMRRSTAPASSSEGGGATRNSCTPARIARRSRFASVEGPVAMTERFGSFLISRSSARRSIGPMSCTGRITRSNWSSRIRAIALSRSGTCAAGRKPNRARTASTSPGWPAAFPTTSARRCIRVEASPNDRRWRLVRRLKFVFDRVACRQRSVRQQPQNVLRTRIARIYQDRRYHYEQLALVVLPSGARKELTKDGNIHEVWDYRSRLFLVVVEQARDNHALVTRHVNCRRDAAGSEAGNTESGKRNAV